MQRACIAIVDAAHARIYTFDSDAPPPALVEVRDLVSPGRQAHGMFTDSQVRAHRNAHSTKDDHRTDHLAELDARFAKIIVVEIDRVLREHDLERVIVVASPKMLGTLRDQDGELRHPPVVVEEIPQNLSWMTTSQLHDHLAAMSLLQPRTRVMPERVARMMR